MLVLPILFMLNPQLVVPRLKKKLVVPIWRTEAQYVNWIISFFHSIWFVQVFSEKQKDSISFAAVGSCFVIRALGLYCILVLFILLWAELRMSAICSSFSPVAARLCGFVALASLRSKLAAWAWIFLNFWSIYYSCVIKRNPFYSRKV